MIDQIRLDSDRRVSSTNGTDMDTELREYASALGVELYGVASATDYEKQFPDKPQPARFVENARSIIVIGLPYEPGTMTTVLRPELSGLRRRASDHVSSGGAQPVGAENFFMAEESEILKRELSWIGYKIAKFLRMHGWNSLHLPPSKQDARFRTAPFYHMPAMYLAGMGTLGLNCCILTPEFGPTGTSDFDYHRLPANRRRTAGV